MARPIITLTTDFGLRDSYVAEMKAVLLRHARNAQLIDVTHALPRHDILAGSIALQRAVDGFPPGTIHLAVVDPGVGTDRRLLIAEVDGQFVVCPDNGLITWTHRYHRPITYHELTWRPRSASHTFHGRDVMAPVAGQLATGTPLRDLTAPLKSPVLLDVAPARAAATTGRVIHVDHFGNATTNIPHATLRPRPAVSVSIHGQSLGRLRRTYWDVAPGQPLALIGSAGLLEIAVRDGSAASTLKLQVGDKVSLTR